MRRGSAYRIPQPKSERSEKQDKEKIYNIFPDIEDPSQDLYYLPFIDAIYQPFEEYDIDDNDPLSFLREHEFLHSTLSNTTTTTCLMRAEMVHIMASVMNHANLALSSNIRISIPSFTIKDNDTGKTWDWLQNSVTWVKHLLLTTGMLQELMLLPIMGYSSDTSRERTKLYMEYALHEYEPNPVSKYLATTIDTILDVYECIGPEIFDLYRYACNLSQPTPESIIMRFGEALGHTAGLVLNKKHKSEIQKLFRERREQVLTQEQVLPNLLPQVLKNYLPDAECISTCPLHQNGTCAPDMLKMKAKKVWSMEHFKTPWGDQVYSWGADLIDYMQCSHGKLASQGKIPISIWKYTMFQMTQPLFLLQQPGDMLQNFLGANGKELSDLHFYASPLVVLGLRRHEDEYIVSPTIPTGKYSKSFIPEDDFTDLQKKLNFIYELEALRQQMWSGEGPYCICYPNIQKKCFFKFWLLFIWNATEPDSENPKKATNWKQKKPECIKDMI